MANLNVPAALESRPFRLALAQINTTVGDLDGNTAKIIAYIERARELEADLIAFPELAVTGYPPEDLLFKPSFIADNLRCLERIVAAADDIAVIVGYVDARDDLYNAAAFIANGKVEAVYHKIYLPNYGVFDEDRYFQAGREAYICRWRGVNIGFNICEDIWFASGPTEAQSYNGAHLIVNINASPYHRGKGDWREKMLATRASDNGVALAYVNLVGGQDELMFDGNSLIFDGRGEKLAEGSQFAPQLLVQDLDMGAVFRARLHDPRQRKEKLLRGELLEATPVQTVDIFDPAEYLNIDENGNSIGDAYGPPKSALPPSEPPILYDSLGEVYAALVLGTRDYVRKNGFNRVVLGLSGGIDSALVATIAADALGAENVTVVSMPSQFSSEHSKSDAALLAASLGLQYLTVPIEQPYTATIKTIAPIEDEVSRGSSDQFGLAEENLQARIRGNILMTLSNKYGWLVLTTGNKSEMATGYSTLYGDMAGGFAVIKDVQKTLVFQLCEYRNQLAGRDLIPRSIISKPPSAELRPDQLDSDSLPPYATLDPILQAYVEDDRSPAEIEAMGFDSDLVRRVIRMVDRTEYKRRQAPPGIKITPRAFGRDRRLPITNAYRR
jgi:NAD+ synthase (glutamine-hydrolysing)